jgi:hypothetical protein
MKRTLILLPTYSGSPEQETQDSLKALKGVPVLRLPGCSDVTLARNRLLTQAVEMVRANSEIETLLCLDDDIVFSVSDAEGVVNLSRNMRLPVSAVYTSVQQKICAMSFELTGLHLAGMGFLAIPSVLLLELAERLEPCLGPEGDILPFCTSGPWFNGRRNIWQSDDYSFCRRLGGVYLAPIAVGHVKKVPLYPDEVSVQRAVSHNRVASDLPDTTPPPPPNAAE